MDPPLRLIIILQSRLFSQCLSYVLSSTEQFEVKEVEPGEPNHEQTIGDFQPQVSLIDFDLPNDWVLELLSQIHNEVDGGRVIALIDHGSSESLLDRFECGADGWVLKDDSLEELKTAIDVVNRGERYVSPRLADYVFSELENLGLQRRQTERAPPPVLTARELEVLSLIAEENLSNKEVARRLSVSLYTVKNHVHHILEKLSVPSRQEAANYALRKRWLPVNAGEKVRRVALGHKNIQHTVRYTELSPARFRDFWND
jgi:DNA-binding NarL/FixJ family response regulator